MKDWRYETGGEEPEMPERDITREPALTPQDGPRTPEEVQPGISVIEEGRDRGVVGTPTFFINSEMASGLKPPEFWEMKIRELAPDAFPELEQAEQAEKAVE